MTTAIGQPPAGSPPWLNAVWIGIVILAAVFGRGFGTSFLSAIRNLRAGLATRESVARQQERNLRAEADEATALAFTRMQGQLQDADKRIAHLDRQVTELQEAQRHAFIREQQTMSHLSAHAVWDHAVGQFLPDGYPAPPPLLPPREQMHAEEWGTSLG